MRDLKLSVQFGLLANVFPRLRAVCVESRENLVFICYYCDGEASEDDRECCASVLDEVFADFFSALKNSPVFETPIVRIDYPKKMPLIGEWVYYRYEKASKIHRLKDYLQSKVLSVFKNRRTLNLKTISKEGEVIKEVSIGDLKLSVQKSLLGNVFPNLRAVWVNLKDSFIQIYFYYDKNISKEELSLCEDAMNQTKSDFLSHAQNHPQIQFETRIERIDFPKKMPINDGHRVFFRQEDTSQYID